MLLSSSGEEYYQYQRNPHANGLGQSQTSLFRRLSGDCGLFSLAERSALIVQFLLLLLLQVT